MNRLHSETRKKNCATFNIELILLERERSIQTMSGKCEQDLRDRRFLSCSIIFLLSAHVPKENRRR